MKAWHLAALTLSLWYMLMPPISKGGGIDATAPLRQWQRELAFSVKGSCTDELMTEIDRAAKSPAANARSLSRLKQSICISEDDPRLGAAKPKRSD
ncbi:MAG: hypothetical protein ACREQR_08155 [Candidatus Binataceae bacterium]